MQSTRQVWSCVYVPTYLTCMTGSSIQFHCLMCLLMICHQCFPSISLPWFRFCHQTPIKVVLDLKSEIHRIAVAVDEKTLRHGGHQLGWGLPGRLWWRSEPSGHWGGYPGRHLHLHQLRQRHRPTRLHDRIRLHVHLNPNTLSYDLCKVRVFHKCCFDLTVLMKRPKAFTTTRFPIAEIGDCWSTVVYYQNGSFSSKWELPFCSPLPS